MTEETTQPKRRGRKPRAVEEQRENKLEIDVENKEQESSEEDSGPAVEPYNKDLATESSATQAEPRIERGARIIPKGDAIEVKTDDNGYAQETVYQEIPLMGTDQVSKVLVVREGTFYKK